MLMLKPNNLLRALLRIGTRILNGKRRIELVRRQLSMQMGTRCGI